MRMASIFISYRRDDDPGFAHAIYQRLRQAFPGDNSLFMDVGHIRPGEDFVKVLNTQVEQCDVLLAIIGERWIDAWDAEGNLRLWQEDDFVRIEIASALAAGKLVIPVLVNKAQMPGPGDLPPSLQDLALKQAVEIRNTHFDADTQRLINGLKNTLKELAQKRLRERWERELSREFNPWGLMLLFGVMSLGSLFVAYNLGNEVNPTSAVVTTNLLLLVALVIALGFGFVNGFHDTANAVTTVIYTHSLPPRTAVVWSATFNFLGVLASTGGVAFSIASLLPVDLILQVGSAAGFAMVFALLIAAIIWNLGTWYLGLPASSSHTLIGSIVGVGIANALMHGQAAVSGVDLPRVYETGQALLLSPLGGFAAAALLLVAVRRVINIPALYVEPTGKTPPPWWIRAILILTCTSVSYVHGSNDGQKGMGLIMLILIVTPVAYALNRVLPPDQIAEFRAASDAAASVIQRQAAGYNVLGDPRRAITLYVSRREPDEGTFPSLVRLVNEISTPVDECGALPGAPASAANTRKDMYLVREAIGLFRHQSGLTPDDGAKLDRYTRALDRAMRFIPPWVQIAVALALGLGTMMGWKRIVVTVGERIGRTHLTYAQGASAELVAAATIGAANLYSLPVSTTHVLSSGIAGTMSANGSGLQRRTIVNIVLGWVLTLPVAIALSAGLYWAFSQVF